MTNAEKYKEVFGFFPDYGNCPADDCIECPCVRKDSMGNTLCYARESHTTYDWWQEEYKGNDTVKVEVTEVHTFAKPDDVSDIDFPSVSSEDK